MENTQTTNLAREFGVESLQRIMLAVADTVELSVYGDKGYSVEQARAMRGIGMLVGSITGREAERRTDICVKDIRMMRGDLKWSLEKIIDFLPVALRCELDGGDWVPEDYKKRRWAATNVC